MANFLLLVPLYDKVDHFRAHTCVYYMIYFHRLQGVAAPGLKQHLPTGFSKRFEDICSTVLLFGILEFRLSILAILEISYLG